MVKVCTKCGTTDRYKGGLCKLCAKARARLQWKFPGVGRAKKRKKRGWAPGEHEKAEAALPNVTNCACCNSNSPRASHGVWLADHDHKTGKFRAHICHPCNQIIGYIETYNLDMSPSVAAYLAKFVDNLEPQK